MAAKGPIVMKTKDFDAALVAFSKRLEDISKELVDAAPRIQDIAAAVIADLYRAFLRRGVGDELQPITKILHELGDHPPLSTLADHVIIEQSSTVSVRAHTRGGGKVSVRAHKRGQPAMVLFEKTDKDWNAIAVMHDRGFAIQPTDLQRKALIARALLKSGEFRAFLDGEGFESQGIWLIPARPHAHFLEKQSLDQELATVARAIIGGKVPDLKTSRPSRIDYRPPINLQIDTIQI